MAKITVPKIRKFAAGGGMEQQAAPAGGQGGEGGGGADPMQELAGMIQEYQQSHDPQLADQIINIVSQVLGIGAAQGGGQGGEDGGQGAAPEMAAFGTKLPIFAKGGEIKFKKKTGKKEEKKEGGEKKNAYQDYVASKEKKK